MTTIDTVVIGGRRFTSAEAFERFTSRLDATATADPAPTTKLRARQKARAAERAAHDTGVEIGKQERRRLGLSRPGPERTIAATSTILEERGYEPYREEDGCVRMRSCPFHALAEQDRDLVCHLNEQLIDGVVRGLGNESVDVVFDPVPGQCCVRIDPQKRPVTS